MIIAIQQPEHFPWLGFFNKMRLVDEFIYLDNVQFKKRYFENRNRIRTGNACGWEWLTVPVETKGRYTQKIKEVKIAYNENWQRKYLNKLKTNYNKAPFFKDIFKEIEEIINKEYKKLIDLNLALIVLVSEYLDIKTPIICASNIYENKGSDLILELCLKRGADTYLSGPDGRNYLDLDDFKHNNIKVIYHDYIHPIYPQLRHPFISQMSAVDLLFNYGKESLKVIKEGFRL